MKMIGIYHLKDKYINELSGGEKQMVFISRAIAQDTEILLLDEPTAHLDLQYQIELLTSLNKLNKEKNKTIIIILHDINLAAQFCKEVILMKDGMLLFKGSPVNVLTTNNLNSVYNIDFIIEKNSTTKKINIIPLKKINNI